MTGILKYSYSKDGKSQEGTVPCKLRYNHGMVTRWSPKAHGDAKKTRTMLYV